MKRFKKAGHVVVASHAPRKGDQGVDPSYTENQVAEPPDDQTPRTNYLPPPNIGQYQYVPTTGEAASYYSSAPPQIALAPQTPFTPAPNYYAQQHTYMSPPPPNYGYPASPPPSQSYQASPPPAIQTYDHNQPPYTPEPPQQPSYDPHSNNYGYQPPFPASPNFPTSLPPQPINPPGSGYGGQTGSPDPFVAPQRADTYHQGYPDTINQPLQRTWGTAPGAFDSPKCRLCGHYLLNGNCTVCSQ